MSDSWLSELKYNPLPALQGQLYEALDYFVMRDLLEQPVEAIDFLWSLPGATRLVARQQEDGSWKYRGKTTNSLPGENYFLLETYRNLRILVEMYGFNRQDASLQKAAEFVFSCQTKEGDIRGILGKQYMPYYHGAILELLVKAGYEDDPRIKTGLEWLLSMRQEDGGWIVPTQLVPWKERTPEFWQSDPILPTRSKPHAHMATGMILRPFAEHPGYRSKPEVIAAGEALKTRILKPDKYNDRKARKYWFKFQFPFWWTSLVTCLDSLAKLGFDRMDEDITRGMEWFIDNQERDGLWPTGYGSGSKADENRRWVGLAICRIFKCFDH